MDAHTGIVFVVAAPSGAGKTSLVKAVIEQLDDICSSISHTTRPKRSQEQEGEHYHFVDHDTFAGLVKQEEFVEHAEVYGHFYGTSIKAIDASLAKGKDIILDIDWQGARGVKARYPENTASIFLLPPNKEVLYERLCKRNQDHPEVIEKRMQEAKSEMQHYNEFNYLLINDNFAETLEKLINIIHAERMRLTQQSAKYNSLISSLLMDD